MRKYIAIMSAAFLWYSMSAGLIGPLDTSLALAIQSIALLSLTIFLGPSFGVTACLVVGFLLDSSTRAAFGIQSLALLTTYAVLPETLSALLRNIKLRFIVCAILAPIMYVSVIWFVNGVLGWFTTSLVQPIDPSTFRQASISSLWSGVFASVLLVLSGVFFTAVSRRFYFRRPSV